MSIVAELCHKRNPEDLKLGDHVYVWRSVYSHHGIVVEVPPVGTTEPELSQRIKIAQVTRKPPKLSEVNLKVFCSGDSVRVVKYGESNFYYWIKLKGTCNQRESHDPEEVVERAKKSLEELDKITYNLIKFNCEHWATYCKTGVINSEQVDGLLNAMVAGKRMLKEIVSKYLSNIAMKSLIEFFKNELIKEGVLNSQGYVIQSFSMNYTKIVKTANNMAKMQLEQPLGKFLSCLPLAVGQLLFELALFIFRLGKHFNDDTYTLVHVMFDTKKSVISGSVSLLVIVASTLLFGKGLMVIIIASIIGSICGSFAASYLKLPDKIDTTLSFLKLTRNSSYEEISEKRRKLMKLIVEVHPDNFNCKLDERTRITRYYFLHDIRETLDKFVQEKVKERDEVILSLL